MIINNALSSITQIVSNRNLIDNPWFTVNQRGQSEYGNIASGGEMYTFDRWFLSNSVILSCYKNADGSIGISSKQGNHFAQRIETPSRLLGKTVTLSVNHDGVIKSETITIPDAFPDNTTSYGNISLSTNCSFFIRLYANGAIRVCIGDITNSTNTWSVDNIRAVKLELGTVSTLANDIAPDYGTELAKCQRYLYVATGIYKCTSSDADNGCFFSINLPVKMRATPSLIMPSSFVVLSGVPNNTISTFVDHKYSRGISDSIVQINIKDTSNNKYSLNYSIYCKDNPIYISADL